MIKSLQKILNNLFIFFSILLILATVYSPALLISYAHHDDYNYFGWTQEDIKQHPPFSNVITAGRFLGIFLINLYGFLVHRMTDLNLLRFITISYLSFCAFICYRWMGRYFLKTIFSPKIASLNAFLFVVMIFTLPPFQVLISLAAGIYETTGILFATIAAILACKASVARDFKELVTNKYTMGAVLALLFSLMIHQTATMFYWFMIFILILPEFTQILHRDKRKIVFNLFFIGFSSFLIYSLVLLSFKDYLMKYATLYTPFFITREQLQKIFWFFEEPLFNSLNLWSIFPSIRYAGPGILFILLTIICYFFNLKLSQEKEKKNLFKIIFSGILLTCLIFLSFLPNLLSYIQAPFYRCCLALTPMVLIVFLIAFNYWLSFFSQTLRKYVSTFVLILCFVIGSYTAYQNILDYRVIPSYMEINFIKNKIQGRRLMEYQKILVVVPESYGNWSQYYRYDEFIVPSMYFFQDIPFILRCVLNELGIETSFVMDTHWILKCKLPSWKSGEKYDHYLEIRGIASDKPPASEDKTLIIDMHGYHNLIFNRRMSF